MLTEQELQQLPAGISYRLEQLNTQTLELIGNRIKDIGKLSVKEAHSLQQLKTYGSDIDEITRQLSKISGKNVSEIYDIYDVVAKSNSDFAARFYSAKGLPPVPYSENVELQRFVKAMAKQTASTYINMAQTTGFMLTNSAGEKVFSSLSKTYNDVIDRAVTAVATGVQDYQSAMQRTIVELADSGLRTRYSPLKGAAGQVVDYASGYSRRLDTSVRQNILWGVKQCNQSVSDMLGEEFGADGYEISYHSNPRPSHAAMGGERYAIGKGCTVDGEYYPPFDDVKDLLEDYGCLHFKFPIILSVSVANYSREELDELKAKDNKTFEFEGEQYTGYEATQVQRKLETAMRHAEDRMKIADAAGNDTLSQKEQAKINQLTTKYKQFSKAAKLPTRMERAETVYYKAKTRENKNKSKGG